MPLWNYTQNCIARPLVTVHSEGYHKKAALWNLVVSIIKILFKAHFIIFYSVLFMMALGRNFFQVLVVGIIALLLSKLVCFYHGCCKLWIDQISFFIWPPENWESNWDVSDRKAIAFYSLISFSDSSDNGFVLYHYRRLSFSFILISNLKRFL